MRLTFEQEQAVDRAKEQLVPAAEKLLNTACVVEINKNDLGESQLRNLIALANETESPAVVLNFLRYQMGRDTRGRGWSKTVANGKTVGQLFLDEIESGVVYEQLEQIAGQSTAVEKQKATAAEKQLVKMALIRNFLGFASRYMKFLDLERASRQRGGRS